MLLSFPWLFIFLVFAPHSALSVFEYVAYSRARQCDPFTISFSGGQLPAALPLTLTAVPFNSTPISFTVPESAWDNSTNSGSYTTFLPLSARVSFVASLDDAAGDNAALISDVIQVLPSTDASCIPANQTILAPLRLADNAVSQCSPFNVMQNTSSLDHTLSVRVLTPTSLSFSLQRTKFYSSQGVDTFTYIMNVASGLRVALLFDDGQGNRQVSDLISVGRSVSNSSECLRTSSASSAAAAAQVQSGAMSTRISRSATSEIEQLLHDLFIFIRSTTIAIAVSSCVALLAIIILGIVLVRYERRKLTRRLDEEFQNHENNKRSSLVDLPPPTEPAQSPTRMPHSPAPVDPVYPPELFMSPSNELREPRSTRTTVLAPFVPWSLRSTKSRSSISRSVSTKTKNSTIAALARSLVDLDIAGLLEQASQQPAATEPPRGYPAASPHTVTPLPTPSVPPSPSASAYSVASPSTIRGATRNQQQPDVPLSPLSRFSQELLSPEQRLTVPEAALTVTTPRDGPSSRSRPLPMPPRSPGQFTVSRKPVRF